ncbi:uncharacterized protein AB9W97_005069 [Spinachia spinachia]
MMRGGTMRGALVALVLASMFSCASAAEKLSSCCESVGKDRISAPILSYMVQMPQPPCVKAVIFQTEGGLFCSPLNAPWVRKKIRAFMEAKASSSAVSLLSIITSTASVPSSVSPSFPSSSSSPSLPHHRGG